MSGAAIGLDAGTSYTVAQALPCKPIGEPSQTFDVVRGDQGGFPDSFPIRTTTPAADADLAGGEAAEMCLQPYVRLEPMFGATAFVRARRGSNQVGL